MLVYAVVAVLAASAGVCTTIAVQHGVSARQAAPRLPGEAAAGRPERSGALNDEAVYNKVEPGIVDVSSNLRYLQETAEGAGFVIDAASGLVLTSNHVIDGATSVTAPGIRHW